ncbi:hypothetical protein C7B76_14905 [filamentous cyanobacterium CCP2]|nr:hypothetical protein C7B76_14905 [filamentous cyanobacterium CCP2]
MSYCINPHCSNRYNPDSLEVCQTCGTPLLIQERYILLKPLRELDDYGQSEIFLVNDRGTSKVLKILKEPKRLQLFEPEDPVQMFEREARTLQKLRHPGIPQVEPDGYFTLLLDKNSHKPESQLLHCLVMEYIAGQNLEQWLADHQPIDSIQAIDWLKQLTEILEQVHQNEVFHRDIKPSNMMLRPDGQLVLIDFGSTRPMTNTYFAKIGGGGQREITSIVSPGYTPLEQVNGKAVPQSDFYALGRSFVYLLTGKHPISFPEDTETGALCWRDAAPQLSSTLADLLDDLMAPFPGQRPLNTQEIWQRLTDSSATATRSTPTALLSQTPTQAPAPTDPKLPQLRWLIVLNIGLLILQMLTWGIFLRDHYRPTPPVPSFEPSISE